MAVLRLLCHSYIRVWVGGEGFCTVVLLSSNLTTPCFYFQRLPSSCIKREQPSNFQASGEKQYRNGLGKWRLPNKSSEIKTLIYA